jgi:hypothetical protein
VINFLLVWVMSGVLSYTIFYKHHQIQNRKVYEITVSKMPETELFKESFHMSMYNILSFCLDVLFGPLSFIQNGFMVIYNKMEKAKP